MKKYLEHELNFKSDGQTECSFCGIASFDHRHRPNTLPRDFDMLDSNMSKKYTTDCDDCWCHCYGQCQYIHCTSCDHCRPQDKSLDVQQFITKKFGRAISKLGEDKSPEVQGATWQDRLYKLWMDETQKYGRPFLVEVERFLMNEITKARKEERQRILDALPIEDLNDWQKFCYINVRDIINEKD